MKMLVFKLFLMLAVYAIALGAFCRLGTDGIVCGLVAGTALSGIILLARRETIGSVVALGVGSLVGYFFGVGSRRHDRIRRKRFCRQPGRDYAD